MGYDAAEKEFEFRNSAGPGWGKNGYGAIPENYIIKAREVCPYLQHQDRFSAEERNFVLRTSKGVSGSLGKLTPGNKLPAEAQITELILVRFNDPTHPSK